MTLKPLAPGARIGILGGGQLGRMMAQSAAELGFLVHIYCPEPDCPAAQVAPEFTCADYSDQKALKAFAESVDAITYEFENVPQDTAHFLNTFRPVAPAPKALGIAQDRWLEKTFIQDQGIDVAQFFDITSCDDLVKALDTLGGNGILKTRRFGYDGKGQWRLSPTSNIDEIYAELNAQPAILEGLVLFQSEISVIIARDYEGNIACYDPTENSHENHILRHSRVPGNMSVDLQQNAQQIAHKIATALDYIGVLAIELFIADQKLIVNEIAPRVHNSGHWTMDAAATSQFTQHIRAISAWPLGSAIRHSNVEMENLLGDEINNWLSLASEPNCHIHLYGKQEAKPGRKMGHVNRTSPFTQTR